VDTSYKPGQKAPFRYLFLDLNSYFASVEQQERKELRERPVGVVQVIADGACIIAASYEAKRYGVVTGTLIREAKEICPEIALVEANHPLYVKYHERIIEAIETVVPVEAECSIDEVRVHLLKSEATRKAALEIALRIKKAIRERVGECLTCSIGLAPNAFLAKVGTKLQKPNGLVMLLPEELEERLKGMLLTDLPGINRRMVVRLNLAGIYTTTDLLRASKQELRRAFGSVIGARWWHLLKGHDIGDLETKRQSFGHEHVLPPEYRSRQRSYEVLLRLIEKGSARLRKEGYSARAVSFRVRGRDGRWETEARFPPSCDTLRFIEVLRKDWKENPVHQPTMVSVAFYNLTPSGQLSLFESENRYENLARAADKVNQKFGKHKIFPAAILEAKETAPERIGFLKTSLFSEGFGDNAA